MAKNLIGGTTTTINESGNDISIDLNTTYTNFIDVNETLDTTAQTLPEAINENKGRLDDLVYTENITLASNININANSNYGSGTQNYALNPKPGYVPIHASVLNAYNYQVNLWYCNVNLYNNAYRISWRAGNSTSSNISNITILVRVIYIKADSFLGDF